MNGHDRTKAQNQTLAEVASLLIQARRKAAELVRASGADLSPDERDFFGRPCLAELDPPPTPHICACSDYGGSGGEQPCLNTWIDSTGPDDGTGSPTRICEHTELDHAQI
ncbi:DUF6422 family protein [Streptomyces sp. NPDC096339]|uniref:DUF6422 family protein n=1 Tax=Streptomyces sp. NPDC096339 TaxID=3366086 RepID=UPI00382AFFCF